MKNAAPWILAALQVLGTFGSWMDLRREISAAREEVTKARVVVAAVAGWAREKGYAGPLGG